MTFMPRISEIEPKINIFTDKNITIDEISGDNIKIHKTKKRLDKSKI